MNQRHTCAIMSWIARMANLFSTWRTPEGGMVGDHGSPLESMHLFGELVDAWIEHLQQHEQNIILASPKVMEKPICLVDDVHAKHVFGTGVPHDRKNN